MARIQKSVGQGGSNLQDDVKTIQNLLNRHLRLIPPTTALVVDGDCGKKTVAAIRAFQSKVVGLAVADGRVDPGGRTLSVLNGETQRGPAAAQGYHYPVGPQEPLIEIARPYIGAREAAGNRMGDDPRMREIFESDWLHDRKKNTTDGYAWCCSFVSMCVQKLIRAEPLYVSVTPPRTAGVTSFRTRWAVQERCLIFPPNHAEHLPHKGDVVVFTFSHIGIVDTVEASGVTTIEGNTNEAGSREGTSVMNKTRPYAQIRCFIRLPIPTSYDTVNQVCRLGVPG